MLDEQLLDEVVQRILAEEPKTLAIVLHIPRYLKDGSLLRYLSQE